jgi:hypothetical protein
MVNETQKALALAFAHQLVEAHYEMAHRMPSPHLREIMREILHKCSQAFHSFQGDAVV